jgi:hypothetical protein
MSQMAADTANVVAEIPWFFHGDTEASPSPDPSANRVSDTAAATNAPAKMAGQEAAAVDLPAGTSSPALIPSGAVGELMEVLMNASTSPARE